MILSPSDYQSAIKSARDYKECDGFCVKDCSGKRRPSESNVLPEMLPACLATKGLTRTAVSAGESNDFEYTPYGERPK